MRRDRPPRPHVPVGVQRLLPREDRDVLRQGERPGDLHPCDPGKGFC